MHQGLQQRFAVPRFYGSEVEGSRMSGWGGGGPGEDFPPRLLVQVPLGSSSFVGWELWCFVGE